MLEYTLRRAAASREDAEALSRIEAATLSDSDLSADEMQAVMAKANQYVYLAHDGAECIGMLATFETPGAHGPRLELDMLGVARAWRGRGVARALVRRAMAEGRVRGCASFRAAVATNNAASRRVFESCGLQVAGPPYDLLTRVFSGFAPVSCLPDGWSMQWLADLSGVDRLGRDPRWMLPGHQGLSLGDGSGATVAALALLRVDTIAYSGYWIEKAWACDGIAGQVALLAAAEQAKTARLDEVGILLPEQDPLQPAALDAGYRVDRRVQHSDGRLGCSRIGRLSY